MLGQNEYSWKTKNWHAELDWPEWIDREKGDRKIGRVQMGVQDHVEDIISCSHIDAVSFRRSDCRSSSVERFSGLRAWRPLDKFTCERAEPSDVPNFQNRFLCGPGAVPEQLVEWFGKSLRLIDTAANLEVHTVNGSDGSGRIVRRHHEQLHRQQYPSRKQDMAFHDKCQFRICKDA
jgi:hypothetical protein